MVDAQKLRSEYSRYREIQDNKSKFGAVYYEISREYGYNQKTFQLTRIWGKPQSKDAIGKALGAIDGCGGATINPNPEELDHGDVFTVKVWGCD